MSAEKAVKMLSLVNQCRLLAIRHPGDPAYRETLERAERALDDFDRPRGYLRPKRPPRLRVVPPDDEGGPPP